MLPRRHFLLSLAAALPVLNCASLPADATRRAGALGDPTAGTSPVWRPAGSENRPAATAAASPAPPAGDRYTCVMHPEIDQPTPGVCPKCGMDLVLKKTGGAK